MQNHNDETNVVLCAFLLALGGFYYVTGQTQLQRVSDMKERAADASAAMQGGDYTGALRLALEATDRKGFDPPVAAKAQAALAEIVGAYDYVPGYKPLRSVRLSGKPYKAAFSPGGDLIAILTNHGDGEKRVQIFDAKSGKEQQPALEVQSHENCAFLFIGYDTLLYAGKNGLTSYDLMTGKTIVWNDAPSSDSQTGLARSADGKVVAYVVWETQTAYIFDAQTQTLTRTLTLEETSDASSQLQKTFPSAMERMVALDATGRLLAVSLPGGGTGLFPTDGSESVILSQTSQYRYFEGGFFEHFFFYTASNAWTQTDSETFVQTECRLIDLDTTDAVLELQEPTPIHAQADENGIYLSIGSDLYRVNPNDQTWDFLVDVESPILSLQHAAGRLLVITSTKLALVYRDDGAWRVEIARGQNYLISGLSKNYLFLATLDKALLSVLEWDEKTGDLLPSREKKTDDNALTFKAGGWSVQQTSDDAIEISYGGKSKKMDGVQLVYASEMEGKLLLSLKTGEKQYGVILDKQLDEIANLPGFCEMTPDGMLLFDDQQGNLCKGSLYSVEDLRTLANQKLEAEIK